MKRFLRMTGIIIGSILVVLIGGIALFMYTSPQFGSKAEGERLESMKASENYQDGIFINLIETKMSTGEGGMLSSMYKFFFEGTDRSPDWPIPVNTVEKETLEHENDSTLFATWFGHSAILIEIDGKRVFLDPMLGNTAAPVAFMTYRFNKTLPISIDKLPEIDVVVFSHDHYDHLDYPSVKQLKDKVKQFYVPLGLGAHLEGWGVDPAKIKELDWWQSADFEGLRFVATPSRHFSGRGISDRNATLWASWVVEGKTQKLFFSGDSGYFEEFKQIGEKYGPFDIAFMECGQYNKAWANIHMMPEETVQAHLDVKAKVLMPIHWGAFNLALHSWTEPVERALAKSSEEQVQIITPMIGERFVVGEDMPNAQWWKKGN